MTTTTTDSTYLWLTEDYEAEVEVRRKNATTGDDEAATGLSNVSFAIAATPGGAAIGTLTQAASERGTTGVYFAIFDTATLVSQLSTASYPDGTTIYLTFTKTGDIASRSWPKIVRRQRVGDG